MTNSLFIPGYEGLYSISDTGLVYSHRSGKYLVISKGTSGYLFVTLSVGGVKKIISIHRYVAILFVGNHKGYKYVNHIDGNKLNNDKSNLEWCTFQYNIQHAFKIGLYDNAHTHLIKNPPMKGKTGYNNKLSKQIIQLSKDLIIIGEHGSARMAGKILGIKFQNILRACNNINRTAGGFKFRYKIE